MFPGKEISSYFFTCHILHNVGYVVLHSRVTTPVIHNSRHVPRHYDILGIFLATKNRCSKNDNKKKKRLLDSCHVRGIVIRQLFVFVIWDDGKQFFCFHFEFSKFPNSFVLLNVYVVFLLFTQRALFTNMVRFIVYFTYNARIFDKNRMYSYIHSSWIGRF